MGQQEGYSELLLLSPTHFQGHRLSLANSIVFLHVKIPILFQREIYGYLRPLEKKKKRKFQLGTNLVGAYIVPPAQRSINEQWPSSLYNNQENK
jgi:hypothetical protein